MPAERGYAAWTSLRMPPRMGTGECGGQVVDQPGLAECPVRPVVVVLRVLVRDAPQVLLVAHRKGSGPWSTATCSVSGAPNPSPPR